MSGVTIFKREKKLILDKIKTQLFVNDVIKSCQELDFGWCNAFIEKDEIIHKMY